MPKFIVLQGLPASGKTTEAFKIINKDPKNWIRVNNDDLRKMLWGNPYESKDEELITELRMQIISEALEFRRNIIVDNINLNPKLLKDYRQLAELYSEYDYQEILINTPLSVCIARDSARPNPVGESVIRKFSKMLPKSGQKKFAIQDPNLPHVIICDLDGTLSLNLEGKNQYDRDFENDTPNLPVVDILLKYLPDADAIYEPIYEVFFVSGRKEKFRQQTLNFLDYKCNLVGKEYFLFMRKDDDNRDDALVKKEIFDTHIRDKYFVEFVLDDRNKVVKMWRDLGLTCLQVAEGDF